MSDPYLGEVRLVGFNFAPNGWALCNGQLISISQYSALFSLLGTTYGGDGRTTFALPNLQGRAAVHQGQLQGGANYSPGQMTGVENVTLTLNQMPAHTHAVNCNPSPGTSPTPAGMVWAEGPNPGGKGGTSPNQYASTAGATMSAGALSPVGGGQPFSNLQPLLVMTYIISLQGIYPSRT